MNRSSKLALSALLVIGSALSGCYDDRPGHHRPPPHRPGHGHDRPGPGGPGGPGYGGPGNPGNPGGPGNNWGGNRPQ